MPKVQADCEIFAVFGMGFLNQRMSALTGNAEYMDVLERSLYNGALDGLSLSGDRFFYGNPLASRGQHQRREWFGTACCPANIARLVASLGNYIYAYGDNAVYVNLYVGSNTSFNLKNGMLVLKMETNYPWEGKVKIIIDPVKKIKAALHLRLPGWVQDQAAPGGLYTMPPVSNGVEQVPGLKINVNGTEIKYTTRNGYLVVDREWKKGDQLEFEFPMDVKQVNARVELKQDQGRVALQRGPLVYCVEGADNNGKAWNIIVPPNTKFETIDYKVLDENVKAITAEVPVVIVGEDGQSLKTEKRKIVAIPYYTWDNRGKNEMQVWLPVRINDVKLNY